ncbi:hypothetical protein D3C72_2209050 [compost metagenome]
MPIVLGMSSGSSAHNAWSKLAGLIPTCLSKASAKSVLFIVSPFFIFNSIFPDLFLDKYAMASEEYDFIF